MLGGPVPYAQEVESDLDEEENDVEENERIAFENEMKKEYDKKFDAFVTACNAAVTVVKAK